MLLALAIIAFVRIGYVCPGFSHMTLGEATLVVLVTGVLGQGVQISLRPDSHRNVSTP